MRGWPLCLLLFACSKSEPPAPLALAPGLLAMGLCLRGQRRLIMVGGVVGAAAMFQLLAGTGLIGSRYYLGAEDDNSAASHDALLQVALAIALDNPISGVVHEHFEELSLEYAGELDSAAASNASLGVDRPHNDFLTVWISWGIAALVAYVFLFLGAIFYMIVLVKNAVASVREDYVRVALDMGANQGQVLTKVLVPGALPQIWEAVAVCNGIMWTYIVLAEYINSNVEQIGLGYLLNIGSRTQDSGKVFATLILIGLVSTATDWLMQTVKKRFFAW